jgi:hypothetical protein
MARPAPDSTTANWTITVSALFVLLAGLAIMDCAREQHANADKRPASHVNDLATKAIPLHCTVAEFGKRRVIYPDLPELTALNESELKFAFMPTHVVYKNNTVSPDFVGLVELLSDRQYLRANGSMRDWSFGNAAYDYGYNLYFDDLTLFREKYDSFQKTYPTRLLQEGAKNEFAQLLVGCYQQYHQLVQLLEATVFYATTPLELDERAYAIADSAFKVDLTTLAKDIEEGAIEQAVGAHRYCPFAQRQVVTSLWRRTADNRMTSPVLQIPVSLEKADGVVAASRAGACQITLFLKATDRFKNVECRNHYLGPASISAPEFEYIAARYVINGDTVAVDATVP